MESALVVLFEFLNHYTTGQERCVKDVGDWYLFHAVYTITKTTKVEKWLTMAVAT